MPADHLCAGSGIAKGSDGSVILTVGENSRSSGWTEALYCRRGQAENYITSWKTHLAADRTSCPRGPACQMHLILHTGAYWLMWSLRRLMPAGSSWQARSSTR
jgi:Transposase DDE domain group 1